MHGDDGCPGPKVGVPDESIQLAPGLDQTITDVTQSSVALVLAARRLVAQG